MLLHSTYKLAMVILTEELTDKTVYSKVQFSIDFNLKRKHLLNLQMKSKQKNTSIKISLNHVVATCSTLTDK